MVFNHLRNTTAEGKLHELHRLLSISKLFKLLLEPLLYETITQSDLYEYGSYTPKPKAISGLLRAFLLNPDLASDVRSIYIEEVGVDHDLFSTRNAELLAEREKDMARELVRRKGLSSKAHDGFESTGNMDLNAILGLILSQLPNLRSLKLVLWHGRLEGYISHFNFLYLQTLDLSWQGAGFWLDMADESEDVPQGPVAALKHLVKATGFLRSVKITAYYGPAHPGLADDIEADVVRTRDILLGHEDTLRVKDLSFVEDPLLFCGCL